MGNRRTSNQSPSAATVTEPEAPATETAEEKQQRLASQLETWQREIDEENAAIGEDSTEAEETLPSPPPPPPQPSPGMLDIRGFDPNRPDEWFGRTGAHLSVQTNYIEVHFQRAGRGYAPGSPGFTREPELATIEHSELTSAYNTGEGSELFSALNVVRGRRAETLKKHTDRREALEAAKADPLAPDALEKITALSGDEATEANIEAHWLDAECKAYDDYLEGFQQFARGRSMDVQNVLMARKYELVNEIAAAVTHLLDRLVDVHYSLQRAQTAVPDQVMPVGVPVRPVRKPDFQPTFQVTTSFLNG